MALYKRGDTWWYSFIFFGKRYQESTKSTSKTVAGIAEKSRRRDLEKALAGEPVEKRTDRVRTVKELIDAYRKRYPTNHRPKSVLFMESRLAVVKDRLGATLLIDLTEDTIFDYIAGRTDDGVSGRTINMELGELSRAIGKQWSVLWPRVRRLEERTEVGKALSPEEEERLLDQACKSSSRLVSVFVRIALLTGMRPGEIIALQWDQINFNSRIVTVGLAKTKKGTGREIPMNDDLFEVLSLHAGWFCQEFGVAEPQHFLFPFGKGRKPLDPSRHITDLTSAWDTLRAAADVRCRMHDLRHTAATKMAEKGVPESTMLAILGHMSRAMLERYSHIRIAAKRSAVTALSFSQPAPKALPSADSSDTVSTKITTVTRPN